MKKFLLWIKALVPEGLIFMGSCFLFLARKISLKWEKPEYRKKSPILLVHGYLNNAFVWFYHGKKIINKGIGPIYALSFKNPFSSIQKMALEIENKILEIQKNNPGLPITLIGHSMGGLAASYFALNFAKKGSIEKVITIASPLKGTLMASFGIGKCAREMKRNSGFINSLNEKITIEKNINFYNIATKTDQLVIPYESALMKDAKQNFVLNGIGHASLLYSKKVNSQIISWLNI